ncbi:hypothetical protein JY96_07840 [Aquabacterium sp. NJ1]|uniref:hypothetical protein n=1 Tax=Aquabacterium sp. NJ1 TaxID=1538295 RepID=UPI00052CE593|nr:hypothetical protein [Aquabacterium sp. NJ1]KGM39979.1 hypothetical protein JY96_07840 [Aquabacterium sp. NJ1]
MMSARTWQRFGVAGLLGVCLLGGAGWLQTVWLPRQHAQLDEWGSQARRTRHELQAALQAKAGSQPEALGTPEQAWQRLWQTLPGADQRVALQSQVLAQARQQGLVVNAVQYAGSKQPWAAQDGVVLWRQRMVMPVEGGYGAVRAWLAQLLQEPALSIDSLDLQRSDVMSDQVKARVAVSLWWRRPERIKP